MNTQGKARCPLPGCDYTREDYTPNAALGWILHMQFHIYFRTANLPAGVK